MILKANGYNLKKNHLTKSSCIWTKISTIFKEIDSQLVINNGSIVDNLSLKLDT